MRSLLKEDVRFHDLETAGHSLGRAVAQATTNGCRSLERNTSSPGPWLIYSAPRRPVGKIDAQFTELTKAYVGAGQPLACSIAPCRRTLGWTPTNRSTTSPSLKIITVGMLLTP